VLLFLPLVARWRCDPCVRQAGYPGSPMVPAVSALLSWLALKLRDQERRSHLRDFSCDAALGLFAGLNILPQKRYAPEDAYRTARPQPQRLLSGWVTGLTPRLFPEAQAFGVDFQALPYRGAAEALANHSLPLRGKAGPSSLTFWAPKPTSRVLC
jgi:hypothetical protein